MTNQETTTEVVRVAELVTKRQRDGRNVLNITAEDGRVFGTVNDHVITQADECKQVERVVIEYYEEQRGKYTNRYIESVRPATADDVETMPMSAPAGVAPAPVAQLASCVELTMRAMELSAQLTCLLPPDFIDRHGMTIVADPRVIFVDLIPALLRAAREEASTESLDALRKAIRAVGEPGTTNVVAHGIEQWPVSDEDGPGRPALAALDRAAAEAAERRARNAAQLEGVA